MNKIYLIFIVTCLTDQLKADVYNVRNTEAIRRDTALAYTNSDRQKETIVVIFKTINQGDVTADVAILDSADDVIAEVHLEDPCNMDPSTEEGTLAAILWGTFGKESCPIEADKYVLIRDFNQTGIIESMSEVDDKVLNVIFAVTSTEKRDYFVIYNDVRLVEEEP